jgi:hypothetical protein
MAWAREETNTPPIRFSGLNNLADPATMKPGECVKADNGYFTDAGAFTRRRGRTKVFAGTPHSFWSDGEIALFVEGGELKQLLADYTTRFIKTVGDAPMAYAGMPGLVVYSNGGIIGMVGGTVTTPPATRIIEGGLKVETFMERLPAGELLCNWNGTLCIAAKAGDETWVYMTPAYDWSGIDIRSDYFRYKGAPTLLVAVDDGIYIGAGNEIHFLTGQGDKWETRRVLNTPAVKGASVVLDGQDIGLSENGQPVPISGKVALFATDGAHLGMNGGQVLSLSGGRIVLPPAATGAVLFENKSGTPLATFVLTGETSTDKAYQPQPIEVDSH